MFYSFQIELLSVGTLLAYTMVAISVLLTRYQPGVECHVYGKAAKLERTNQWLESITSEPQYPPTISDQSELEKRDTVKGNTRGKPSEISRDNATLAIFLLVLSISFLVTIIMTVLNGILKEDSWAFLAAVMSGIFIFVALIFLTRQPKNNAEFPITGHLYFLPLGVFNTDFSLTVVVSWSLLLRRFRYYHEMGSLHCLASSQIKPKIE